MEGIHSCCSPSWLVVIEAVVVQYTTKCVTGVTSTGLHPALAIILAYIPAPAFQGHYYTIEVKISTILVHKKKNHITFEVSFTIYAASWLLMCIFIHFYGCMS